MMNSVSKSTSQFFQYPFKSFFEMAPKLSPLTVENKLISKNYKEDEGTSPYFKLVKVRKILYRGKEVFQLKMTHYLFLSPNLPLFNTLPYQLMLKQLEEKEDSYPEEAEEQREMTVVYARRSQRVRVTRKNRNKGRYRKVEVLKRMERMVKVIVKGRKRILREAMKMMKGAREKTVIFKFNLRLVNSVSSLVLAEVMESMKECGKVVS
jgi:hypothetical protein